MVVAWAAIAAVANNAAEELRAALPVTLLEPLSVLLLAVLLAEDTACVVASKRVAAKAAVALTVVDTVALTVADRELLAATSCVVEVLVTALTADCEATAVLVVRDACALSAACLAVFPVAFRFALLERATVHATA